MTKVKIYGHPTHIRLYFEAVHGLRALIPETGNVKASAYNNLDSVFSGQVNTPAYKAWSIKKWFFQFGVGDPDWPAQAGALERQLPARPDDSPPVLHLITALVTEWEQILETRL